ncbi:MAG: hypothetical protein GXC72_12095 [Chitinophagaceae bacterium]|nr:hypothetical protein [Chitinophagaceae bacterium]
MSSQNYQNHSRYVFNWHIVTSLLILALLVGSIVNLTHAAPDNLYSASLLCLVAVILLFIFWYARAFALKAQDRAIRAEENFRHFVLTGKPLPGELRMGQIVALRFAGDAEMPALAQRAVREKLPAKAIKQAITAWKADYNRV